MLHLERLRLGLHWFLYKHYVLMAVCVRQRDRERQRERGSKSLLLSVQQKTVVSLTTALILCK